MPFEHCPECGWGTRHEVWVSIDAETTGGKNAKFSREPYRYRECMVCGLETRQRLNEGRTGRSGDVEVIHGDG